MLAYNGDIFRKPLLIYGLCDPRDDSEEIRYVGQSSQGLKRPKQHATPYYLKLDGRNHKANWIRKLLAEGVEPKILVLKELADINQLCDEEAAQIAKYRALGHRLTNLAEAGPGPIGVKRSEETKEKMAESHRKRHAAMSPEKRAEMCESMSAAQLAIARMPERLEHARLLGAAWKGKKRSEGTKRKMSEAKKAWHAEMAPEEKAALRSKIVAGQKICGRLGRPRGKGKPLSAETKAKMVASQKARRHREAAKRSEAQIGPEDPTQRPE